MKMNIKPVRTKKDYREALERIDALMDVHEGHELDELEILSILVEKYEDEHFPIDLPDPIEAIKFRMEQQGLKQADIAQALGGKNRASEILSGKRQLTVDMIRNLSIKYRIPADSLLGLHHAKT